MTYKFYMKNKVNNGKGTLTGERDVRVGWRRAWRRISNSKNVLKVTSKFAVLKTLYM